MSPDNNFDPSKFEASLEAGDEASAAKQLDAVFSGEPDVKEQARALLAVGLAGIATENELNQAAVDHKTDVLERLQELEALKKRNEEGKQLDDVRSGLSQ